MSYLRHIRACNPVIEETFFPWFVEDTVVGWLRPAVAERLVKSDAFTWKHQQSLQLASELQGFAERSQALADLCSALKAENIVPPLMGEPYPVTALGREDALCVLDRACAGLFGIKTFGQHLNGYIESDEGIAMWIGVRDASRFTYPGKLDNMVAGGLPHGLSLQENLAKECQEEAGLAPEWAEKARPIGAITYNRASSKGFKPDVLYCYDLKLPADYIPHNEDGEVQEFRLLPLEEVARLVRETDDFKLNCNLVVIDFLIRHGFLSPEHPEYLEIQTLLRPKLGPPNK